MIQASHENSTGAREPMRTAHAIEPTPESRGTGQAGWPTVAMAFGGCSCALDICFAGCIWGWILGYAAYILMTVCKRDREKVVGLGRWAEIMDFFWVSSAPVGEK
jgi:hypothetical protein